MSEAAAWIMKVDDSIYASVSQMELVHIINSPETVRVPNAPEHCQNIIVWNDNILPVVDLAVLFSKTNTNTGLDVVAVIIFRDHDNVIQYGGIRLYDSPELETVENGQVCAIPETPEYLQSVSLSCFINKRGIEVPILDTSKLFGGQFTGITHLA